MFTVDLFWKSYIFIPKTTSKSCKNSFPSSSDFSSSSAPLFRLILHSKNPSLGFLKLHKTNRKSRQPTKRPAKQSPQHPDEPKSSQKHPHRPPRGLPNTPRQPPRRPQDAPTNYLRRTLWTIQLHISTAINPSHTSLSAVS